MKQFLEALIVAIRNEINKPTGQVVLQFEDVLLNVSKSYPEIITIEPDGDFETIVGANYKDTRYSLLEDDMEDFNEVVRTDYPELSEKIVKLGGDLYDVYTGQFVDIIDGVDNTEEFKIVLDKTIEYKRDLRLNGKSPYDYDRTETVFRKLHREYPDTVLDKFGFFVRFKGVVYCKTPPKVDEYEDMLKNNFPEEFKKLNRLEDTTVEYKDE